MKLKYLWLLSATCLLSVFSCKSRGENEKLDSFLVFHPILKDTIANIEYVADIHAIENVEIRSRVSGFLDKIHIDEGEYVKEGQLLFTLSNRELQEEVTRTNALLKVAESELKLALLEFKNAKLLKDKNIISTTEVEQAEAKVESMKAKVDEANANYKNAHINLAYTQIKAPFSGTINRFQFKRGSLLNEGDLLTSISNDSEIYTYFNVSESDYLSMIHNNEIKNQTEVMLIQANNELYQNKGIIQTFESEINRGTGTIGIRAKFSNTNHMLKHGSSGKILFPQKLTKSILIPQKSTFEIQENSYVYVVNHENKIEMRKISIGEKLSNLYVVKSGLSSKDKVIYEGIQNVKEGQAITYKLIIPKEI